jgi:hypothetical protein
MTNHTRDIHAPILKSEPRDAAVGVRVDLGRISPARPGRGGSESDLRGGDGDGEKEEEEEGGRRIGFVEERGKEEGRRRWIFCLRAFVQ